MNSTRIAALASLSAIALSAALGANAAQQEPHRTYSSSTYPWSVSYPADSTVIDDNPSYVTFILPSALARCGVHTTRARFETLDEVTDFLLAQTERSTFERTRLESETVSRRRIKLANDIVGNDVVVNITPGGRSRRVFSLVDGIAYVIDCETYSAFWERTAADFDRIIESLTIGNKFPTKGTCAKR